MPTHRRNENGPATESKDMETSMFQQFVCRATLQQYCEDHISFREDTIAMEEELRVRVRGYPELVLARTPGDDSALILGHLFSRTMIRSADDITNITFRQDQRLAEVCLKSPRAIKRIYPKPHPNTISAENFFTFKQVFENRQILFKNTGATHAAALIAHDGTLLAFGEDIGRHNAFDKAVGQALLTDSLHDAEVAMLSSRLALELVTKAAAANIPVLCGFSAATSAAMEFAERNNVTLVGRIRERTLSIYANGWRVRS